MDWIDCATLIFWSLVTISTTLLWGFFKQHFSYWLHRGIPHITPSIPRGNMRDWLLKKHYVKIVHETYAKYKDDGILYAGFYWNLQRSLICLDLGLIKDILVEHFDAFEAKGLFHNEEDDPLTGNLFLYDQPQWGPLRNRLTPTYSAAKMKYIFTTMLRVAEELQRVFVDQVTESRNGIFNVDNLLRQFSSDVMASCAFGVDSKSMSDPEDTFFAMVQKFLTTSRYSNALDNIVNCFPQEARLLHLKAIPQDVTDYFIRIIHENAAKRQAMNIRRWAYLDFLLELQNTPGEKPFSTEELASNVFVFLMTAYDTCASTMSHALYELARAPFVQNKLRQEINRILRSSKYKLTYENLKSMKYLDQVISETLRMYPPSPALFRRCTKEYIPPSAPNFYIEKGCYIIIPTHSLHYDSRYFPNPHSFDPDRFTTSNAASITPFSYLPFGEGQRECIGKRFGRMHVEMGLVKLLKRFKFETCSESENPLLHKVKSYHLVPTAVTLKVTRI